MRSVAVLAITVAVANSFVSRHFPERTSLARTAYRSSFELSMGARNRAWAKGDLSDKDIFEDEDSVDSANIKKDKFKLSPEVVFFEGPPSPSEILFPAISILTVVGIIPFVSAVSRQFFVKYKFTSRRISIQSGFGGKDLTEIIYPDVDEIRFAYRGFGAAGDMVLFLKDGAKVEMRYVPKFDEVYQFVFSNLDEDSKTKSMKPKIQNKEATA